MVIFDPETGEVIDDVDGETDFPNIEDEEEPDDRNEVTIVNFDEECDPAIEDCFGPLADDEEEHSEDYPHEMESVLLGVLAEVESFVPLILWFTLIQPSLKENVAYKRAWYAIWVGSLLSYGVQAIMWPLTFFIKESELLYKFYKNSWRYLGSIGRYAVDFFVICALLVAANDYE